jgi:hypothetical protein
MRSRLALYFLVSLFLLLVTFLNYLVDPAFGQGSPALRSKAVNVDNLIAKAGTPDGVRVILTLRGATPDPASAPLPSASASVSVPQPPATSGPLGDGQPATLEQVGILARHLGNDVFTRQRWATRLIYNAPYMAMTVNLPELEALAADSDVISIHEDGQLQLGLPDTVPLVGMPAAYAIDATGQNTSVAILDVGVDFSHIFLTPRVTQTTCFSTADASFATLCPNGQNFQAGGNAGINCDVAVNTACAHGTHVAGIAAGFQATGSPPSGVAKFADVFAIQVFRRRLSDNALLASDSDMIAALNDLRGRIEGGEAAKVVAANLSIWDSSLQVSGSNCDTNARAVPFKAAIDALRADGVATVIISGNGSQTNQSAFPGCISSATTVSATSKADVVASYANMSDAVDLLAPGGEGAVAPQAVTSSIAGGAVLHQTFGGMSGTSMAAPHVTGAFAAIRSSCPGLPSPIVDWIEGALINTGIVISDTRSGGSITRTRIRVDLAVQNLRNTFPAICLPALEVFPSTGVTFFGPPGGPFGSALGSYALDASHHSLNYSITGLPSWLGMAPTSGPVTAGSEADIVIFTQPAANSLPAGTYQSTVNFNNTSTGNGNTTRTAALVIKRPSTHDFNGDGRGDILWRDNNGNLSIWLMNAATVSSSGSIGTVPSSWSIVGQRDFNGDGKYDLLWRDSAGNTAIWFINGLQVSSSASLGNVPLTWNVIAVADFNGDGRGDILWRDTAGNLAMWLMNGASVSSSVGLGNVPLTWSIAGNGDYNGDGKADLLWRDTSGNTAIWLMNGAQVTSSPSVGNIPTNWTVISNADFNGDGKSDLLWRDTSGNVAMWFMNGAQVLQSGTFAFVPTNWSVVGSGDYNGDGYGDLLWRDMNSGALSVWFPWVSSQAGLGNVPTNFVVQNTLAE